MHSIDKDSSTAQARAAGQVLLNADPAAPHVACVTLSHPGKFNAMSRAMWRALREVFTRIQHSRQWRCVLLKGADGHFCAGGDIAEYPGFRFDSARLRDFHEGEVWGGLAAMLDCDVPIIAAIEGNCMGAGVEIASACDIRVAAHDARFGAPIARLGFPMAEREAALVSRAVGEATARSMLLEAAILNVEHMQACGFLHAVLASADLPAHVWQRAQRIASLAPQAARLNKRTLRKLSASSPPVSIDSFAINNEAFDAETDPYAYADSAEHREGIAAFLEKRPARF